MKKILIVFALLFLTFGCSLNLMDSSPKESVREFLDKYNNNDSDILDELDTFVEGYDFTDSQKDTYKEILKKQYKDLKYDIQDEKIDGNTATVTAKITVYDFYKAEQNADLYMQDSSDEFTDENKELDESKFNDYKLEQMKNTSDTIDYDITFNLTKKDNKWIVDQLSTSDLEKIHGVYNYENE